MSPMAFPNLRHSVGITFDIVYIALHGDGLVQDLHLFPRKTKLFYHTKIRFPIQYTILYLQILLFNSFKKCFL